MAIPNFFIVGAAKVGTTFLYNYLINHPEVYLSPIKEPNYFNTELKLHNCREDIKKKIFLDKTYFEDNILKKRRSACFDEMQDYLQLYRGATSEKIIGEASTYYLASTQAAKEIYKYNKTAKVVIILREPVSRTMSHYNMDRLSNRTSGDMLQDVKSDFNSDKKGYFISNMYIDLSLYYDQISRYLKIFPKEQILILRFENLVSKKKEVLGEVCDFLEIDFNKLQLSDKVHNKTEVPKNKFIQRLIGIKKILPRSLQKYFLFLKVILFKPFEKDTIYEEVLGYIKSKVDEDFKLVNELLHNHFSRIKK